LITNTFWLTHATLDVGRQSCYACIQNSHFLPNILRPPCLFVWVTLQAVHGMEYFNQSVNQEDIYSAICPKIQRWPNYWRRKK